MIAALLLKSLCSFLEKSVEDYAAAQNEKGEYQTPQVYPWYLPFKNPKRKAEGGDVIDFPYIVARIESGQDPDISDDYTTLSTVTIQLAFGVYHESEKADGRVHPDGAFDLLNLMEHVRISLFRQTIIDRKYRIEKPYTWSIPDEQPYPLWVGQATSIWTVQSATDQLEGGFLYGGQTGNETIG